MDASADCAHEEAVGAKAPLRSSGCKPCTLSTETKSLHFENPMQGHARYVWMTIATSMPLFGRGLI